MLMKHLVSLSQLEITELPVAGDTLEMGVFVRYSWEGGRVEVLGQSKNIKETSWIQGPIKNGTWS